MVSLLAKMLESAYNTEHQPPGQENRRQPDVAVREMIQNAHDTSIIRTTVDKSFTSPSIRVTFDREKQTLTFADNGAGMAEDELHENLSTIGESFTRIQKDELRGANAQEAALLIGQFGIGLLSAFSISERVHVYTRSYQDGQTGRSWSCEGDINYTTEAYDKPEVGTRVVLHLLDSKLELLDEKRLRQAFKRYADFLSVPILLQGNQVNECTPPWEADEGQADLHEYVLSRWGLFPLGIISFNTANKQTEDGQPLPKVSGLLFVPMIPFELARGFGEVDVYISRMFIKANDKTKIIPGHGRVSNKPEMQVYRDMLATVRDRVWALLEEGKPRDQVIAAKPTKEFDARWGRSWLDPETWTGLVCDGLAQ